MTTPAQPVQPADRVITMREALKRLPVCRETIRRWERLGRMPARRQIGCMRGWLASEFDAWMATSARAEPAKPKNIFN